MDNVISASSLNDFIFCPVSVYYHRLYDDMNTMSFQNTDQINGTYAHKSVDENKYSTDKNILTSISAYSEKYNIICKIDIFDGKTKKLRERKRQIQTIYDGYIFQLYAQYFAIKEMGYEVDKLELYSMTDNKGYKVPLPEEDKEMFIKFENIIEDMKAFNLHNFTQDNAKKCLRCIYEPACDRSLTEK
ncbi:MAG TPA: type V CRISPR-associated protein Cas4 [Candidatus Dorea intestinavium]|nr:type V CRISPR-associated protein Cas4 [Candidatus Dorea intestinavium]